MKIKTESEVVITLSWDEARALKSIVANVAFPDNFQFRAGHLKHATSEQLTNIAKKLRNQLDRASVTDTSVEPNISL